MTKDSSQLNPLSESQSVKKQPAKSKSRAKTGVTKKVAENGTQNVTKSSANKTSTRSVEVAENNATKPVARGKSPAGVRTNTATGSSGKKSVAAKSSSKKTTALPSAIVEPSTIAVSASAPKSATSADKSKTSAKKTTRQPRGKKTELGEAVAIPTIFSVSQIADKQSTEAAPAQLAPPSQETPGKTKKQLGTTRARGRATSSTEAEKPEIQSTEEREAANTAKTQRSSGRVARPSKKSQVSEMAPEATPKFLEQSARSAETVGSPRPALQHESAEIISGEKEGSFEPSRGRRSRGRGGRGRKQTTSITPEIVESREIGQPEGVSILEKVAALTTKWQYGEFSIASTKLPEGTVKLSEGAIAPSRDLSFDATENIEATEGAESLTEGAPESAPEYAQGEGEEKPQEREGQRRSRSRGRRSRNKKRNHTEQARFQEEDREESDEGLESPEDAEGEFHQGELRPERNLRATSALNEEDDDRDFYQFDDLDDEYGRDLDDDLDDDLSDEEDAELNLRRGKRKMFVSVLPGEEVEVVLAEDGQVHEYYIEMLHQAKTKGNIYKGVISNIDSNLQAAFVSYGAVKNGFLQIDEVHPEYYLAHHEAGKGRKFPPMQKVLKPGQEILVQVVKEPTGNKGAFLTTYLSIPGRFLVLTPGREQIGVSRKVDEDGERSRLRGLLEGLKPGPGLGVIVRTVSMGSSKTSLRSDLQFLKRLWRDVRNNGSIGKAPCLIYQEPDLASRAVRDYLTEEVGEIWVDDEQTAEHIQGMAELLYPRRSDLVNLHKDYNQGLWERFNLQKQLDQIQSREVVLPSGGRLVFDQTEALMAIDINTAKATGKSNFESTVLRTNMEAAEVIPRQLKLRDVGGQVVIDFIEMREQSHWRSVEKTIRNAMKSDRARHDIGRISRFGLMEIVRQRLASSAISVSSETCPHCNGSGARRNLEWQALQVMRDINRQMRKAQAANQPKLTYQGSAELILYMLNRKRERLHELENAYKVQLELQPLPISIS